MKQFVIRDEDERVLAKVNKVLSCSAEDTLANAKTLSFTTLLEGGLEKLREEMRYTVEFEDDLYDIISFKKSMSGNLCFIEISCEHVSYRLNDTKLEFYSKTGTVKEVLNGLLDGTDFIAGSEELSREVTYSSQNSGTVRAVLFDFAGSIGCEVVFHRYTVSLLPHRGESKDTKILNGNVLEINKTINVTQNTASYSLKVKPKCPIGVGDEVHLVFDRLGINERVRVLGIKREPFINENLTLEVGAYEPDLESDSVQVITNLLSQEKTYYGTRISADKGLEIHRSDNLASVTFNADTMAFYQGSEEILYFDAVARKWKLSASVEIHCADDKGNDTTLNLLASGLSTRIQDAEDNYVEIKQTIDGFTVTTSSGQTLIDGGMIVTDNIQLHRLIAKESPNSYIEMLTNGLNFVLGNANTIGIGYASAEIPLPYIIFGEGASPQSDQSGMIKFYDGGLWLGDSADRHSETIQSGTGLFVDVPNDKIYIYTNGERAEVSNQTNVAELIQGLKDYLDGRLESFKPVAVFG